MRAVFLVIIAVLPWLAVPVFALSVMAAGDYISAAEARQDLWQPDEIGWLAFTAALSLVAHLAALQRNDWLSTLSVWCATPTIFVVVAFVTLWPMWFIAVVVFVTHPAAIVAALFLLLAAPAWMSATEAWEYATAS